MNIYHFLVTFSLLSVSQCANILVVFPMPAPSHYILGNSLARGLVEAGHDVTMVSPFEEKNPPKGPGVGKYTDCVLVGLRQMREENKNNMFEEKSKILMQFFMNFIGTMIIDSTLSNENFQKLLNSNQKFDAIILEQFMDDGLRVLQHHFKAPLILFSTIGANRWINPLVGNPAPPSYVPDIFLEYSCDMTFFQRVNNFLFGIFADLNRHLVFFPSQNKLIKKYFPDAPNLNDLLYNVSLVLLNEHESVNYAVPHVPNMISIGGFHVQPPKKLPKDLEDFMNNAKDGVIYFSMGSNLVPSQMPADSRDALMKALGSVKQKVLWKWDEENLVGAPSNFKISKWFPQQDILAHPNTKLFITHGGLLSTTETIHHGVPVLTLPIFGDQKLNAARAQKLGYGLTLPFNELTPLKLANALDDLLQDPKYRENAKTRSKLLHDRPIKPIKLAVYWTEFVIRNKGADHLRIAGVSLSWYQYLNLDVVAFILVLSFAVFYAIYIAIRRLFCGKKQTDKIKKN